MKQLASIFLLSLLPSIHLLSQVSFKGYEPLFSEPLHYKIYQSDDSIKIDGLLKESSWQHAQWSEPFVDIEGNKKPSPLYKTGFKMLWDKHNLYIAAELEEPHIWASLTQRDTIVYLDNDFEIFVDPDGDSHNYFEIEVNALKNVFDLFLTKPYRNEGTALLTWNAQGLAAGVHIDGSLNNPSDTDKKWIVEIKIPFHAFSLWNKFKYPEDQTTWRMNFSRVEWDADILNNRYRKKTDPATGKSLPEHNWVWSPQGVINMHYPERWGYVQFIAKKTADDNAPFQLPASTGLKKYLWLLYYKQHDFYEKNKRFANTLTELGFSKPGFNIGGSWNTIKLEATRNLFEARIENLTKHESWQIHQDGLIRKLLTPGKQR